MFERLTDKARRAMALANMEAKRLNHEYIGTEHILLGLLKEGSGVGVHVLKRLQIGLDEVLLRVERLVKAGKATSTLGIVPQTPRSKKVIEYAIAEARRFGHSHLGTEHLLLGLLREGDGVAAQALQAFGLTIDRTREEVLKVLDRRGIDADDASGASEAFQVPRKLSVVAVFEDPRMGFLADDRGNRISPAMRIELANEIAKRYNAQ